MGEACKHCRNGWFDGRFGQDVECVNGVLIDIDEFNEGHGPDVIRPVAPCHPMWAAQCRDRWAETWENDSIARLEVAALSTNETQQEGQERG